MKNLLQLRSHIFFVLFLIFIIPSNLLSQNNNYIGRKNLHNEDKIAFETTPKENTLPQETLSNHFNKISAGTKNRFVLGGNILWSFQDGSAIANTTVLNNLGKIPVTAWTLNNMRVSLYTDINNIPLWEYSTQPFDPVVDIADNGYIVAFTAGTSLHIRDTSGGFDLFQFALPDSLYATNVAVSRDGSRAVFLATAIGNSTTARAYCINLTGTPSLVWTLDVSTNQITNWAGVKFSPSGSKIVLTGRHHLYVLNSNDGTLIWDHFVDNTETPAVISGDGEVIVTADNSGFVQTRVFNTINNTYELIWQYRIPSGTFTNWGSSVNISADGFTILAGTLIFDNLPNYDGSIICFDTFGDGTPKWVYTGAGDLVDDIAVSDDGRVAAAVTWGDLSHTKPDLLVFDVLTGEVAFSITTPGSFFTVDISNDGKRVFGGGKAVHAREFGNGGYIYLAEIDLGGGHISGNVNLTNIGDNSGVIVKALGTERSAITNISGNYIIENIPPGTYTIIAEKPGYNFGEVSNVVVSEGNTTPGINFSLDPFTTQPPELSASTNIPRVIMLSWSSLLRNPQREIEIARMVGDDYSSDNIYKTSTKSVKNNNSIDIKSISDSYTFGSDSIAIFRSPVSGGPYFQVAAVPISENTYLDTGVFPLRDYYYVINVYNNTGQSIFSNEALGRVSDTLLTFALDVPQASIPTIDGILSPGEWDDAFKLDISDIFGYGGGIPKPQGSVFMYLKFDDTNDMLYVAGEDFLNPTLNDNEGFGLYFDDNNNGIFESNLPFIQEGNFWAYWHPGGADLRFRDLITFNIITLEGGEVEFSDINGHLQGEVAIPMGFLEGYQLQVFGPDKTPGLGAFIIGRDLNNNAIFNGWWPQTMNTVFNPLYFGDVGINVSLDAPPQIPSNINLTRQGGDLLLTWSDPDLGLNNDPLPAPPSINIYKNGTLLTTVSAGVESYLDINVDCQLWYEYQLEAYITVGTNTLVGPISNFIGDFACSDLALTPIFYDDGTWEAFFVVDFTFDDNKFALRFTPDFFPARVVRVETIVNSNAAFDLTIHSDSSGFPGKLLAGPYRVSSNNAFPVGTIQKTLPGYDPPELREEDFWAVINYLPESPGAPGIGVDYNQPISDRGKYYTLSNGWQNANFGNLMITGYISEHPVDIKEEEEVKLPLTFDLKQNYPNPFNPSTRISYQIPKDEVVTLEIFNVLGQNVKTLVNKNQEAGYYTVDWDGNNSLGNAASSGMYLYRIKAGNFVKVQKMMLLR